MVKNEDDIELEFEDLALSDDFVTITIKELILVVYDDKDPTNSNFFSR